VVEVVGAKFKGHASLETPKNICTSECFAKVEFGLLVTDMSLVPKSFMYGRSAKTSADSPLLEKAKTTSLLSTTPRSP
jgi:hypothetical protein